MRQTLRVVPVLVAVLLSACGEGDPVTFTLSLSPQTLSVERGSSETVNVTLSRSGGFNGNVTVTLLDPPAGISAEPFTLSGSATSAPLTLTVGETAAEGPATLTVIGRSGRLSDTATLNLTVSAAQPVPGFTLRLEPPSLSIARGGGGEVNVGVTRSGGFDAPVALTLLNPPAGVSAEPLTLGANETSGLLSITAASEAALGGPAEVTVRASGSGLTDDATLGLSITEAPSPPVITSFDAEPAAIAPGGASTLSWQVSGATNVSIAPEVGAVAASGSAVVSPQVTTTYTLTASNETGSVEAIAIVAVEAEEPFGILVFSKTVGFRHDSIPDGIAAVERLGLENGFRVDATEDAALFTDANLAQYSAVVFLMTRGDVLNSAQEAAFERYIRAGGGFVGVHSATVTEFDWAWYGELVGTYFQTGGAPPIDDAVVIVEDFEHPSTHHLPERWARYDEWYNFVSNPRGRVNVLLRLDTTSYEGSTMGDDHPIAWYHDFDGGRSWYTGLGHTEESYREPLFLEHLLGGIHYAAGR